jgi:hypothetical protein
MLYPDIEFYSFVARCQAPQIHKVLQKGIFTFTYQWPLTIFLKVVEMPESESIDLEAERSEESVDEEEDSMDEEGNQTASSDDDNRRDKEEEED